MNTPSDSNSSNLQYHVLSVEKTSAPDGAAKGNWFRYIIGHGRSKIEGIRNGTLKSVTEHAETFAGNLNTRAAFGYSAHAYRKQKK